MPKLRTPSARGSFEHGFGIVQPRTPLSCYHPIACLISISSWSVWGHPSQHAWERHCDASQVSARRQQQPAQANHVLRHQFSHSPSNFRVLARLLRDWAPRILAIADADSRAETEMLLETHLHWLDGVSEDLGQYVRDENCIQLIKNLDGWRRGRGQEYSVLYMIKYFLLASLLRSGGSLQLAISRAIHIVCPPNLASLLEHAITDKHLPVPDASTLSRFKLKIDCAFMLHTRAKLRQMLINSSRSKPVHLFVKLDSSPFHGRNWLMIAIHRQCRILQHVSLAV